MPHFYRCDAVIFSSRRKSSTHRNRFRVSASIPTRKLEMMSIDQISHGRAFPWIARKRLTTSNKSRLKRGREYTDKRALCLIVCLSILEVPPPTFLLEPKQKGVAWLSLRTSINHICCNLFASQLSNPIGRNIRTIEAPLFH